MFLNSPSVTNRENDLPDFLPNNDDGFRLPLSDFIDKSLDRVDHFVLAELHLVAGWAVDDVGVAELVFLRQSRVFLGLEPAFRDTGGVKEFPKAVGRTSV